MQQLRSRFSSRSSAVDKSEGLSLDFLHSGIGQETRDGRMHRHVVPRNANLFFIRGKNKKKTEGLKKKTSQKSGQRRRWKKSQKEQSQSVCVCAPEGVRKRALNHAGLPSGYLTSSDLGAQVRGQGSQKLPGVRVSLPRQVGVRNAVDKSPPCFQLWEPTRWPLPPTPAANRTHWRNREP